MYHKFREWGGMKFGTSKTGWNPDTRMHEKVEPCPDACGDCGRAKELHVDTWTHEQKLRMLENLAEEARVGSAKIQELIYFVTKEMK